LPDHRSIGGIVKSKKTLVSTLVLIATLALLSLSTVYSVSQDQKVPTKKEFKTLLKTAKEPSEHLKIADYYRQEAARLAASSKEHAELAKTYTKSPPYLAMEAKRGDTFGQGASHCNKWAELQAKEAKEAEALATLHEDMAKAAEQKQQ
jgi:ABC-type Na+ efflux pump permease subunit